MRKFIKDNGLAYIVVMSTMFTGFIGWLTFVVISLIRIFA